MSVKKEERARLQGMAYALKIAKEQGIDALDNDVKRRGGYDIPFGVDKKEIERYAEGIKAEILNTMLLMSCITLRDEFDFGAKRLERFRNRFNEKVDGIAGDYVTWKDIREALEEETGLKFDLAWSEK